MGILYIIVFFIKKKLFYSYFLLQWIQWLEPDSSWTMELCGKFFITHLAIKVNSHTEKGLSSSLLLILILI